MTTIYAILNFNHWFINMNFLDQKVSDNHLIEIDS